MPNLHKEKYLRSAGRGGLRAIRPAFQDFHSLRMTGSYEYPLHQHANYEVIVVERGPYACLLNGAELVVGPDEMLVIKPGDWHQDHLRRGQRHYVLHFLLGDSFVQPGSPVGLFAAGISPAAQVAPSPLTDDPVLFDVLKGEATRADEYSAGIQDAVLEAFFWRMVRRFPAESLSPQFRQRSDEQRFIDQLYRMFEGHVAENLGVDALAALMHLSRRTLSLKCRGLLDDSPAQLFARFKVQKAVQLLLHTRRPVKEIAYELGFENPYHFSRVFKRYCRKSPVAFR